MYLFHALSEFKNQYNHHRLRTEHHLTPYQLFCVTPRTTTEMYADWESYGIDEDGPVPEPVPTDSVVVIPPNVSVDTHLLSQFPDSTLR